MTVRQRNQHVLTLIHLPGGRFTVDCRGDHDGLPWFHMNIPDEREVVGAIVAHRRQYFPGFRHG